MGADAYEIRQDPPAVIAVTHWVPQDLAQFILQFVPNPTNSLVYMQYGPSLAAFREIGKAATNGVLYSTVVASLQDEIGQDFNNRYKKKFGPSASPLVAAQVVDSTNIWAIAAALAGGTSGPGEPEQNRKVAARLRPFIYRGTMGTMHFNTEQGAIPYPDETKDPSLGMPHQFLQIQDFTTEPALSRRRRTRPPSSRCRPGSRRKAWPIGTKSLCCLPWRQQILRRHGGGKGSQFRGQSG